MSLFSSRSTQDLEDRLRRSGRDGLSPAAKDRLASAVLAEYERIAKTAPDGLSEASSSFVQRPNPVFIPIAVLVCIGAGLGMISVADAAKPGDALFGLDQAVEKVRLAVTVRESSRAKIAAEIAQERERELQTLITQQREAEAIRAKALAQAAVTEALASLDNAQSSINDSDRNELIDQLRPIQDTLQELAVQSEEVVFPEPNAVAENEIEVRIAGTIATVSIELTDQRQNFQISSSDQAAIVQEIVRRTGLTAEQVRAVTRFEIDGTDEPSPSINQNTNLNTNQNENSNTNDSEDDALSNGDANMNTNTATNSNENANASAEGSDDDPNRWEIEVRVRDNQTEIVARLDETTRFEWALETTDETQILASIAERTNLSVDLIRSVWEYQFE